MNGLVHHYAPHTAEAMYAITICSALAFAVIGAIHSAVMGRGFQFMHIVTQASSGSTFPIFLLMPFVPFDDHLMAAMAQSWVTIALAGLLGAAITIFGLFSLPHAPKPKAERGYRY